jgi:glycosyltransferase involved in cell wall biosynthesis
MSTPYVSIVMSVFDGERFLQEAIDSLFRQTFQDFEMVVVDDGSTDATDSILRSYDDPRLRTIRNETNLGQPASLNLGLAAATGAYVARLDADDVALPERLARQVAFLDANPATAVVGSAWIEIDDRGRSGRIRLPPTDCIDLRWRLLVSNAFLHSAVLVRRSAVAEEPFDESIGYGEDYELWSRVASRHEVANLGEPLVLYRRTTSSKTATIRSAQAQVDAIAGANIDRVAGPHFRWSVPSSAELASAGRKLLLSRELELEPRGATALAYDILELQRAFTEFFRLPDRLARQHRARVASVLASRLRAIGRAKRDSGAWRSGALLLAGAALRDPGILVRRDGRA